MTGGAQGEQIPISVRTTGQDRNYMMHLKLLVVGDFTAQLAFVKFSFGVDFRPAE